MFTAKIDGHITDPTFPSIPKTIQITLILKRNVKKSVVPNGNIVREPSCVDDNKRVRSGALGRPFNIIYIVLLLLPFRDCAIIIAIFRVAV